MLLRITQQHEGSLTVIAIDGHLVRDGVAELTLLCQGVTAPLALDLTYLQRVDAEGITRLNALADAGAQLRGVSPYIALLLGRSGGGTSALGRRGGRDVRGPRASVQS